MISTQSTRKDYTATAGQTIFAYDFLIYANTDLEVYVNDVKKTLTTDYTVSGVGTPTGGNVTFGTGLANGDKVVILRVVPSTQAIDYISNDKFPAETHETALDKLTILILQAKELIGRAIKYKTTSLKKDIDFPEPQSGQFIRYKADGSGLLETAGVSVTPGAPPAHASTHARDGGDDVTARAVKSGVDASKPGTGNNQGDVYWATDTKILYTWNGSEWQLPPFDIQTFRRKGTSSPECWYSHPWGSEFTFLAPTANKIYAIPFICPKNITLDRIAIHNNANLGGTVRLGIYEDDNNLYPSSLVLDAGEITINAANASFALTINQLLKAGKLYWLVLISNTTSTLMVANTALNVLSILGMPSNFIGTQVGYSVTQTYGALPSAFPAGASAITSNQFVIGVRLA